SFIHRNVMLKPTLNSTYSNSNDRHQPMWSETEIDFTIENYTNKNRSTSFTSEDSQGNINPYAVTGDTVNHKYKYDHCQLSDTDRHPSTTSSERYFRPIILESSLFNDQNSSNPCPRPIEKHSLTNILSAVSSSESKLFSAFVYVSTSKPITKKMSNNDHSLSSADSGVHSSYTQSPRCQLHHFSYDHSLLSKQDNPLYATYDETFSEQINLDSYRRQKYSLV
ncbi:unnamed protein product, partial [Rotaria socialis]